MVSPMLPAAPYKAPAPFRKLVVPIAADDFRPKVFNALVRWRSRLTYWDLDAYSDEELLQVPGIGRDGVRAIRLVIARLKQEPPSPSAAMDGLHPATADLVMRFAVALGKKLRAAEKKYRRGTSWSHNDWKAECQAELMKHVLKGDPLDVAAYAAFCWVHGWSTAGERVIGDKTVTVGNLQAY